MITAQYSVGVDVQTAPAVGRQVGWLLALVGLVVGAFVLGIGLTAVLLRRRPAPSTATAKPVAYENQA